MNTVELIERKRDGEILTKEELDYLISGYTSGKIPDYQMAALCMAILLKGMTDEETLNLTLAMTRSGAIMDWSDIGGPTIDKHSTGGVGDSVSLVLCPLMASCGLKVCKMSGRGLGFTGGTIDKLESLPGFTCSLEPERLREQLKEIGVVMAGQTEELAPADKKMYALRDVTGTIPSIPLITSSIMSKKLAMNTDLISLDVKCGSGAFMKTLPEARELAQALVRVGKAAGKACIAAITSMEQPLGYTVGNALEIKEAIGVLKGDVQGDLWILALTFGTEILLALNMVKDVSQAVELLTRKITSGQALEKFAQMVEAQGGDMAAVYDTSLIPEATGKFDVLSTENGFVCQLDALETGKAAMELGAGRMLKEDSIDPSVGIVLHKKIGDEVKRGDVLATLHYNEEKKKDEALKRVKNAYRFSKDPVPYPELVLDIVR